MACSFVWAYFGTLSQPFFEELFDYNRENYKFDQEQRLERDMQRRAGDSDLGMPPTVY